MELDSDRIKKWDVAADSMIEVKVIVSRMEPHLAELNGTVADLKGQQLVLKGMVAPVRLAATARKHLLTIFKVPGEVARSCYSFHIAPPDMLARDIAARVGTSLAVDSCVPVQAADQSIDTLRQLLQFVVDAEQHERRHYEGESHPLN